MNTKRRPYSDTCNSLATYFPRIAQAIVCLVLFASHVYAAGEPVDPKLATPDSKDDTAWYDVHLLDIEGMGWSDTKSPFDRLPAKAEKKVRSKVWRLSQQSAGVCVRFVTDATELRARWTLTLDQLAPANMTATGASGLDLYVKTNSGDWHWLGIGAPKGKTTSVVLTRGIPKEKREYLLYFPLYNGVQSLELGIPKAAQLQKAPARRDDRQKPILFYGTSITQGRSASRPGMCHPAILGRQLGYPVLNLGFSGNGEMEPELAELLSELDPAVYVLDCLPNMNASELTERTEPFIHRLRKSHPATPILMVEDRTYGNSFLVEGRRVTNLTNRQAYREAYKRLKAEGVKRLFYVKGGQLLGNDGEATIDSSHPTDLGFMRQATVLRKEFAKILSHDFSNGAIQRVTIEQARKDVPRSDTASVVEIEPDHLLMAYHRFRDSEHGGSDFGDCTIWSQESRDGGKTWGEAREIVTSDKEDINVQAPALCRLTDGELLMLANHAHGRASTSMKLYRSSDDGKIWELDQSLWEKSKGQWLQGGNSQLLLLESGRLIFGIHGGTGTQGNQKNDAWCMISDDQGRTWHRSEGTIVLPMRGAMEASLAELVDGELVMSLRTQLGGPFITRSYDRGENWTAAQPSGLVGPESSTCLRRIPGTNTLVLFWNGSEYQQGHHHFGERTPLSAARSDDGGVHWEHIGDIETATDAEFTNLDCTFTQAGNAIVTYSAARPAWERKRPSLSLQCAVIPRDWFFTQATCAKPTPE
ncbi:SGNH/GDSL hydrolase family protein [Adhaeretor mobilis]|uniref:Sialidase B n=1 Tax=Adhaeretor mobilis TaxID=1930276 RepID=A0A517MVA5_9BACT|nr:SGNH/GDSL hydrolase family protein [Adhaeretor mobilis]QDS98808.1 Sialidase B precursor [Adhaeretor mobilis]